MSETAGAENVIPPADNGGAAAGGDNPAWDSFLSQVPSSMHDMFKPHLREWDQNVNNRIQQVHSEYAPWKQLSDSGFTPEIAAQARQLFDAINNDPKQVYELLGQYYGLNNTPAPQGNTPGQGQPIQQQPAEPTAEYLFGNGQQQPSQYNLANDPQFLRMQQVVDTMGQIIVNQNQAAQAAQADAQLDAEIKAAKQKYGDFNETFALGMIQSGATLEQAVQQWAAFRDDVITQHNRPAAPTTINGAGALPSNQIDPTKLSKSDTVSLVANLFKANRQQG